MDKEFTVFLKNGGSQRVSREVAEIIRNNIINGHAAPWQTFSDQNNNLLIMINLNEVTHIA